MRLLNVHTFELREFFGTPDKYVITSHRWSAGNEATIEDIRKGQNADKSGYKKVEGFARFVREHFHHVDWLWIDTCCVKQDSDSERSEAVLSAFRWYSEAEICLAHLADVNEARDWNQFRQSDWFCRGWTLQELLVPKTVIFLSQDWTVIGSKGDRRHSNEQQINDTWPLDCAIASITGIPHVILTDYAASKSYSVSEKLAWMTGRNTTREEDMVYCLFGIFDVAIPVLYGEGLAKANRRLLKEIAEQDKVEDVVDSRILDAPAKSPGHMSTDDASSRETVEQFEELSLTAREERSVVDRALERIAQEERNVVDRALERIARAKALGRTTVKLRTAEIDALERVESARERYGPAL